MYEKVAEFSDHGHMHIPGLPRGKDPRRLPGLNYRMSELTAAVGIAQLNKIDYILQKAQENKQILKEQLNKIPGIEMRTFSDEKGSQGDTLIFSMHNSDAALKLEAVLSANGFGTKILPEAIDWHFAGSWGHILESFDAKEDIIKNYKKTGELLTRSICLNIPVIFEQDQINKLASIIKNHIG